MEHTPTQRRARNRQVKARHPAQVLYLALLALAVAFIENEIQAVATSGPGAAFDLAQLRTTWLGSLAVAYPFVFWPVAMLILLAAGFGFVIDRRAKDRDANAKDANLAFVLAKDLKREVFPMGDTIAAEFPYQTAPVQEAYNKTLAALTAATGNHPVKRGVLVLGKANTGKTRLAYEALTHTLPNWWVLKSELGQQVSDLPDAADFAGRDVVLVMDDAQDYAGAVAGGAALAGPATTLQALWGRTKSSARRTVLVATCRQEPLELGIVRPSLPWLFSELDVVTVQLFDPQDAEGKRVQAVFEAAGAPSAQRFDGTLGSLVLGMDKKKAQYDMLRRTPAGNVLRGMKLLDRVGIRAQTARRVRSATRCVSGDAAMEQDDAVWNAALEDLTRTDFIRVTQGSKDELRLEIRKTPTYFVEVVSDYPNPALPGQIDRDRAALMDALETQKDALALIDIGNERYAAKLPGDALVAYERALAINLYDTAAWDNRGNALDDLDRHKEALEAYDRALELNPSGAEAWYNKGITLTHLKRYEEALEANNQALAINPNYVQAWFNKATTLLTLKRQEEALAAYDRALAIDPNDPLAWMNKGIALGDLGRHEEELTTYDRALAIDPNLPGVWSNKGNTLLALKRQEEALAAYDRALAIDPNYVQAWSNKGAALDTLGRREEALAAYDRALAIDPNLATAWNNKANTLLALKRQEEALAAYDRALAINPNYVQAWSNNAIALRGLGQAAKAEEAERRAESLGG